MKVGIKKPLTEPVDASSSASFLLSEKKASDNPISLKVWLIEQNLTPLLFFLELNPHHGFVPSLPFGLRVYGLSDPGLSHLS